MSKANDKAAGRRGGVGAGWALAAGAGLWAGVLAVGLTTEPRFEDELFHLEFAHTWFEQWPERPRYQFNRDQIIIGWYSAPGWHGSVAAVNRALGGFHWQTAQVVQSLAWIAAAGMAWLLGRTAFPNRPSAAWAGALIYATMPVVALSGFVLFLEPLASLLTIAAAVLLLRRRYLPAAVAIGAIWYAKETAGAVIPALLAAMAAGMLVDRAGDGAPASIGRPARSRLAGRLGWTAATVALACLIVAAVVTPDLAWRDRVRRGVRPGQMPPRMALDWLLRPGPAMTPREPEVVRPDRPPRRPDPLIMRYPSDLREPLNWVIFPGLAVWLGLGLGLAALARTAFGAGLAPPSGRARRLWRVASDRRLVMLLVGAGAYVWIAVEVSAIAFRYLYPIYGAVAVAAGGGFAAWTVRRSGAEGARPHRWHWWLLGAAAAGQFLGVLAYFSFVRERRVGPQGRQAVAEIAARAQPGQAVFSPDARIVRWYGRMPAFWSQTWSVGIERSLGRLLDLDRPERVARLLADADVGFLFTSRQRLQHAEGAFHDGFSVPWLDRLEQAGVIRRIVDNPGWLAWEVVPPGPTTRPEDRPAPDDEDAADGE